MEVIVIGATGLVGKSIVKKLTEDERVSKVKIFIRRSIDFNHPKLEIRIIDFKKMDEWKDEIKGDVLFSALGTTLREAGSKTKQYTVDHDYQYNVARYAAENGVKALVLISSVNADAKSIFFYLRMKGELEEKVSKLSFSSLFVLRPGPLEGKRVHRRFMEELNLKILNMLPKALVSPGMRPVQGDVVAKVAVSKGLTLEPGIHIIGPRLILNGKT
jgi:uncharacterized protein YbjT (DUF2867 family)